MATSTQAHAARTYAPQRQAAGGPVMSTGTTWSNQGARYRFQGERWDEVASLLQFPASQTVVNSSSSQHKHAYADIHMHVLNTAGLIRRPSPLLLSARARVDCRRVQGIAPWPWSDACFWPIAIKPAYLRRTEPIHKRDELDSKHVLIQFLATVVSPAACASPMRGEWIRTAPLVWWGEVPRARRSAAAASHTHHLSLIHI